MQNEGAEMSARGPGREKPTAGQSDAGRRGEVSVGMTASDILSLAVNVAQNDWPLDGLGYGATKNLDAIHVMLDEIYGRILAANRRAVEKRLAKRVR